MRLFSYIVLIFGVALTGLSAFYEYVGISWVALLFACIAGGLFSALFSLIVGRMHAVHQVLAASLEEIKATNPLNEHLGQKLQIRLEVLTDQGFSEKSRVLTALASARQACKDSDKAHKYAADPIYEALKASAFWPTIGSFFFPKWKHKPVNSHGD
jgi:hypothetical protein